MKCTIIAVALPIVTALLLPQNSQKGARQNPFNKSKPIPKPLDANAPVEELPNEIGTVSRGLAQPDSRFDKGAIPVRKKPEPSPMIRWARRPSSNITGDRMQGKPTNDGKYQFGSPKDVKLNQPIDEQPNAIPTPSREVKSKPFENTRPTDLELPCESPTVLAESRATVVDVNEANSNKKPLPPVVREDENTLWERPLRNVKTAYRREEDLPRTVESPVGVRIKNQPVTRDEGINEIPRPQETANLVEDVLEGMRIGKLVAQMMPIANIFNANRRVSAGTSRRSLEAPSEPFVSPVKTESKAVRKVGETEDDSDCSEDDQKSPKIQVAGPRNNGIREAESKQDLNSVLNLRSESFPTMAQLVTSAVSNIIGGSNDQVSYDEQAVELQKRQEQPRKLSRERSRKLRRKLSDRLAAGSRAVKENPTSRINGIQSNRGFDETSIDGSIVGDPQLTSKLALPGGFQFSDLEPKAKVEQSNAKKAKSSREKTSSAGTSFKSRQAKSSAKKSKEVETVATDSGKADGRTNWAGLDLRMDALAQKISSSSDSSQNIVWARALVKFFLTISTTDSFSGLMNFR